MKENLKEFRETYVCLKIIDLFKLFKSEAKIIKQKKKIMN